MKRALVISLLTLLSAACSDAESVFTNGRAQVRCDGTLPVCSTSAGCVLDDTNFAQSAFQLGGTTRVIVRTAGPADLEVALFFRTEESPGTDTEISWYEVGCSQSYTAQSAGRDVFVEAGTDRVFKRSQKVTTAGDHLVEIFSDAQAEVLLRVTVSGGSAI
jgi:hypothetical protein